MLVDLAIWYLRKRKISVLLNMKVKGGTIQQTTNYGCTFDNTLNNVKYLDKNGKQVVIPEGEFKFKYPS